MTLIIKKLLDIDSLSFIAIVIEIEQAFEIEIHDEHLSESLLDKTTLINIVSELI